MAKQWIKKAIKRRDILKGFVTTHAYRSVRFFVKGIRVAKHLSHKEPGVYGKSKFGQCTYA